jgi:hypothetical protein
MRTKKKLNDKKDCIFVFVCIFISRRYVQIYYGHDQDIKTRSKNYKNKSINA